jgi:transcriptional regulator with XRE-family HTH domain
MVPIMTLQYLTPKELALELGSRLRSIRIQRRLEQRELAVRAGISERTVRALELGEGSTVDSLLRVLKAMESLDGIEALAQRPSLNPLDLLRNRHNPPKRVRRRKNDDEANR